MSDIMPNGTNPKADWTDDDWSIFETWIRGVLHSTDTQITFTKKDGTERVMRCTLDPELLPPAPVLAEGKVPRKESTTAIRVYDLDLKEWRSFTTKSVKSITFSFAAASPFPTGPKP